MNKAKIDKLIPLAYEAISETGIAQNGEVKKGYRSQIAGFGAAVTMGSLLSAIAFFAAQAEQDESDREDSKVDRTKLMNAVALILRQDADTRRLYRWAEARIHVGEEQQCKEEITDAAIALKLALNLYRLTK